MFELFSAMSFTKPRWYYTAMTLVVLLGVAAIVVLV